MFVGIDFGAKLSGNTALVYGAGNELVVRQVCKGVDADKWIGDVLCELNPIYCFIDAPLSLPAAYYGKGSDFFFRECDRLTHAMSPMFLGGLTARAMALKERFTSVRFVEAYPKLMAAEIKQAVGYKTNINTFTEALVAQLPVALNGGLSNWHQVDAVLAWYIGYRYTNQQAFAYGNANEGQIFV
jgi:uncharacterized protein